MKRNWWVSIVVSTALIILCIASIAQAQVNVAPTPYTQNFDALSNAAGSTTNNLTIPGWFLTESGGSARDNEQYAVDTGSSNTGDTYSYGAVGSTDRALGSLRSGTLIPIFGAAFTNNTGGTIGQISIAYTCEEWRLGTAARTDQLNFEYSIDAISLTSGTWINVSALNCITPNTVTIGAKDGNTAANRLALSATFTTTANIANGSTFWIRWVDADASGADDGLAVDDFSLNLFTPSAVTLNDLTASATAASPAPIAFGLIGLTAAALLLRRRTSRSATH